MAYPEMMFHFYRIVATKVHYMYTAIVKKQRGSRLTLMVTLLFLKVYVVIRIRYISFK